MVTRTTTRLAASQLPELAQTYLAQLHKDQRAPVPGGVDERSDRWAESFLRAIRTFREGDVSGEARRAAKRFGLSSAKDKYRFFWELWQNADDAKASSLTFTIREGQLVIENDGTPFSSRDVYSSSFIASSQKTGDISQKGQFGIGFLSLMKICGAPEIHSGPFHFRLERDYTYPVTLQGSSYLAGTRVVAPLRDDIDFGELAAELVQRLAGDDEILLYMSTLRRVEVRDESTGTVTKIETKAERSEKGAQIIYLGRQRWLQYRTEVEPPPGLEREDGEPIAQKIPITLARCNSVAGPHRVSAFFPTNVIHWLPWRFSAPFEVTTNREALLDSKYNEWLLQVVGDAMVDAAIDQSVGDRTAPWRLVPPLDDYSTELQALVQAAHSKLKQIAWLPTRAGSKEPDAVAIPASPELKRLIRPSDIDEDDVGKRIWLSGSVDGDGIALLIELGAYLVCCHELSAVLATGPERDPEWYLRTAAESIRLADRSTFGSETANQNLVTGRCFKDRRGNAFSLKDAGRDRRVVCNARSETLADEFHKMASRQLILLHRVYRPAERKRLDPRDDDRDRVNTWLRAQSGDDGSFRYEFRLEAPQFIRHFLATDGGLSVRDADQAAHDRLVSFLRDHIGAYLTDYPRDDRLSQIGQNLRLTSFSFDETGKRISDRRSVGTVYLGGAFGPSPWATAARGVPSIWWLSDKYRRLLSREADGLSTMGFLRKLGATECPRVVSVAESSSHGVYRFARVTRGDETGFPNFPHKAVGTRWFSEYGSRGDCSSPDINRMLAYTERLPASSRVARGQALLRTLEQYWSSLSTRVTAQAHAYSYKQEHSLGSMPTRWIHKLQTTPWMRFRDGSFQAPLGRLAATPGIAAVLGGRDSEVCSWDCKNTGVAEALGMPTALSAHHIISRLQKAKASDSRIPGARLTAYYRALAEFAALDDTQLTELRTSELIHTPSRAREWWPPSLCYLTDQRGIFADGRAYLTQFREADALWGVLGIHESPDLTDLIAFWGETARADPSAQGLSQLDRSYFLANKLTAVDTEGAIVPLWTDQGWCESDKVVATDDEELWEAVSSLGLPRWQQQRTQALHNFSQWCGLVLLEHATSFHIPKATGELSPPDIRVIRTAIHSFAADAARLDATTLKRISTTVRRWLALDVKRADTLLVSGSVDLPARPHYNLDVRRQAFAADGTLYLSGTVSPEDPEVVAALLSAPELANLSANEYWNLANALRVKLLEAALGGEAIEDESIDLPEFDEEPGEDDDLDALFDDAEGEQSRETSQDSQSQKPKSTRDGSDTKTDDSPPAITPVDEYEIESDEQGGKPASPGQLLKERTVLLRRPGGKAGDQKPVDKGHRPSPLTTEARGVALYVKYVLDRAGVRVSDQRLRKGVGADILGDDRVFRELKTFSRGAPDKVSLTRHERARAMAAAEAFELVIVEHVWSEPAITIFSNPISVLDTLPAGTILVTGWRARREIPEARVVKLKASDSAVASSNLGTP